MMTSTDHPRANELKRISEILDQFPIMSEMVWQDLTCQGQKSESGAHAQDVGMEKRREARMDCTDVSSNIHEPSDFSLLWDAVRVITRMLHQVKESEDGLVSQNVLVGNSLQPKPQHQNPPD